MKKNDTLKKHHFWILFGLVPLFVLIAVLTISSSVGGEIEKRNKEIEDAKGGLSKLSNPKSNALIELMDGVIKRVDGKRGSLWKANWDRQQDLYIWPKSDGFRNFVRKTKGADGKDADVPVRIEDLKFGEPIVEDRDQFEEFRKPEFYRSLFSTVGLTPDQKDRLPPGFIGMADGIAPTQFNGGWERILRHVTDFGIKKLSSDQIWLMMEDVWVQRSMLQAVKSVNDQMSEFQRIIYKDATGNVIDDPDPDKPTAPKDPLRRKFRSRVWEVALEVKTRGNKTYITGSLENITDRLQVLGIGKTMTLKVWLEKNRDGGTEGVEPVEFRIGSDFLPGKGGVKRIKDKAGKDIEVPSNIVITQPDESNDKEFDKYFNIIPPGKTVAEIVKVEQVFDTQTVPVRRIEAMAIGTMMATDSRYAALGLLLPPPSPPFTAVPTTPAAGTQPGSVLPPPMGFDPTKGSSGSSATTGVLGFGGGPIASVIDGNRRRYVEITPQVRRMPVAIVVVVDQAYIQDMLLAFANSPLRFQITQVTWHRFRGNIGTGSAGDGMGPGGSVLLAQPGIFGGGFGRSSDPDMAYPGTRSRPFPGSTPFPMSSPPSPPFSGSPPGGMPPGGMGSFDPYGEGSGSLTTVSEAQLTSGLVELSIYGIVSLYEKYNAAADTAADAATPKEGEAKDKEPKEKDPKEKDPKEKDALPTAPTNPKMRVRRRAA